MTGKVYLRGRLRRRRSDSRALSPQFGGKTLDALMLSATLNPGQLSIVREIVDGDKAGDIDMAVYGDLRANYTITSNADGSITVEHVTVTVETDPTTGNNRVSDGIDRLWNIEKLKFADQEISLTPPKLQLNAFDAGEYADNFNTASLGNSTGATAWNPDWVEDFDSGGVTAGQIRIDFNNNNDLLFIGGTGANFDGAQITRALDLAGATSATLSYSVSESGLDANDDTLRVFFSRDGSEANFVQVDLINSTTNNANRSIDLSGYGPFTAGAAIRFVASSFETNDQVVIDDLTVDFLKPANPVTTDYETTFTEGGASVAIASLPGIVEDGGVIHGATIVLTNAQAGDFLNAPANLPGNISRTIDTSVPGQITVRMTGVESIANYQAAIQQVTFSSNSQNPSTVDRTIQVTVNDGFLNSNVATTTVNVVAVNDPVNGNNDTIVTNIDRSDRGAGMGAPGE